MFQNDAEEHVIPSISRDLLNRFFDSLHSLRLMTLKNLFLLVEFMHTNIMSRNDIGLKNRHIPYGERYCHTVGANIVRP